MTHWSMEEIQTMNALEQLTGAKAQDVILEPERIIFVVQKQDVGKAIGRNGSNVSRLKEAFNKNVEIVQAAENEQAFFANLFHPAPVQFVVKEEDGRKSVDVVVHARDRGTAIGRSGEKIKRAKLLAKRYYGYEDVRIVVRG